MNIYKTLQDIKEYKKLKILNPDEEEDKNELETSMKNKNQVNF